MGLRLCSESSASADEKEERRGKADGARQTADREVVGEEVEPHGVSAGREENAAEHDVGAMNRLFFTIDRGAPAGEPVVVDHEQRGSRWRGLQHDSVECIAGDFDICCGGRGWRRGWYGGLGDASIHERGGLDDWVIDVEFAQFESFRNFV